MISATFFSVSLLSLLLSMLGCMDAQGVLKTFEKNEDVYIFLILPKYIYIYIFHLVLPFRSNRRYLHVSQDKIS